MFSLRPNVLLHPENKQLHLFVSEFCSLIYACTSSSDTPVNSMQDASLMSGDLLLFAFSAISGDSAITEFASLKALSECILKSNGDNPSGRFSKIVEFDLLIIVTGEDEAGENGSEELYDDS